MIVSMTKESSIRAAIKATTETERRQQIRCSLQLLKMTERQCSFFLFPRNARIRTLVDIYAVSKALVSSEFRTSTFPPVDRSIVNRQACQPSITREIASRFLSREWEVGSSPLSVLRSEITNHQQPFHLSAIVILLPLGKSC